MSRAAGEYNRRIKIVSRSGARDAANQPLDDFTVKCILWAKILGSTGMAAIRAIEAGFPPTTTRYSFRIKYRPVGITLADAVQYGGVNFDIRDIRHDLAGQEYTDLVCEYGGNNG